MVGPPGRTNATLPALPAVTTTTPEGWQSDIYRIRVSDGRYRRLTYTSVAKEFAHDWAPDGSEIAFTKQNQRSERYGIAAVKPERRTQQAGTKPPLLPQTIPLSSSRH